MANINKIRLSGQTYNIQDQNAQPLLTAGRGIDITNDTISVSLPISAGTGTNSIIEGRFSQANGNYSHAEGYRTIANNQSEHVSGQFNVSSKASNFFGESGNTLFSVGNGESESARHNAFEIRQNGDIYITSGGTDIKLQDNLGGGSITVDTALDSGSTNPVENRVIYNKIDEVEEVTAAGLNALNDKINPTVELTQAQYNALVNGGTVDPNTFYIITDATAGDLSNYYTKSETSGATEISTALASKADTATTYTKTEVDNAITAATSTKQDTLVSGTNIKTINNESILGSGNINIQGGGGTVESAITSGSTNAVESKAIWSATTFNKGILLTFNKNNSTNYPEGCGKLMVDVGGYGSTAIYFKNNEGWNLGRIEIQNIDGINISVDTSGFGGATYEISGTTVILSYPSTGITSVQTYRLDLTYTAVVEGAWVNDNTYMKSEVDAIASGLQNNINSKLDATAYTPTVVDSALNVASTNPIQNQALYSELRIDNGETETTLTIEDEHSTNYPNGCTKLIVELVGSNNGSSIHFYNGNNTLGSIVIMNYGNINVSVAFDGATYEISGTTVIINYPTVTSVTNISVNTFDSGNYVYKAIVALATPLKNQVVANTTALSSVEDRLSEDEEVTAAGLNALNDNFGGMKLVKLSEAEYNALATKDASTLYIIVN